MRRQGVEIFCFLLFQQCPGYVTSVCFTTLRGDKNGASSLTGIELEAYAKKGKEVFSHVFLGPVSDKLKLGLSLIDLLSKTGSAFVRWCA